MCASKPWPVSSVYKNVGASTTQGSEYSLSKKSIWVGPNSHVLLYGQWTKVHKASLAERGRNGSRSCVFPIFDIVSLSGDIRDQSCIKSVQILHVFGPQLFRGGPPKFLDRHYLIGVDSDHVVKFRGDRPRELGDPVSD